MNSIYASITCLAAEWMTPDLMSAFQANVVVANGLRNPKCMAAMQLMQSNPEEAKKKFANDPDVDLFLREFGRLMADHFNQLSATSSASTASSAPKPTPIQEIGPLQAQAMQKQK